jgi:hypothetical protein
MVEYPSPIKHWHHEINDQEWCNRDDYDSAVAPGRSGAERRNGGTRFAQVVSGAIARAA